MNYELFVSWHAGRPSINGYRAQRIKLFVNVIRRKKIPWCCAKKITLQSTAMLRIWPSLMQSVINKTGWAVWPSAVRSANDSSVTNTASPHIKPTTKRMLILLAIDSRRLQRELSARDTCQFLSTFTPDSLSANWRRCYCWTVPTLRDFKGTVAFSKEMLSNR